MEKKLPLFLSLALIGTAAISICSSFSIAAFVGKAKIDSPIKANSLLGNYVFLQPGVWSENGFEAYCIETWDSANTPAHSFFGSAATVSTKGEYVFNVDLALYAGFRFLRYRASKSLSALEYSPGASFNWTDGNNEPFVWNVSQSFTISVTSGVASINGAEGKNLYTISGHGSEKTYDGSGHELGTVSNGSWTDTYTDTFPPVVG